MLGSNFSRLIIAHYFKYNNIFEKKKGGGVWTHGPLHDAFGVGFFFLPARKSKKLQLKVNMQYQVSIKLLVYYGG